MFTKSVSSIFICIEHLIFILGSYPTDILKFASMVTNFGPYYSIFKFSVFKSDNLYKKKNKYKVKLLINN